VDIRYYMDPETQVPHIRRHGVTEHEVGGVLWRPMEDRPGRGGANEQEAPYLSLDDPHKLDEVREALRRGDIRTASRLARVFSLTPLSA